MSESSSLSDFAAVCLQHYPDPDGLERIGHIFIDAARELRSDRQEAGNA